MSTPAKQFEARYHVPYSQVHPGSRGGQRGKLHLHVRRVEPDRPGVELTAVKGRRTKITRGPSDSLCAHKGWYERPPETDEDFERCPECVRLAERYGVEWPTGGAS